MKAAVSGSHGFIGSRLVETLEEQGHDVMRLGRNGTVRDAEWVFDLAAYGNLHHQSGVRKIYKANLTRLLGLLDTMRNCKAFITTSTSSVDLAKQTFYSASKMAAEYLVKAWVDQYDEPIVIVRPYTVVGVGEPDVHLIPKLIDSCYTGEEIPFVPDPVHDFVDVQDVVDAMILIAKYAGNHKKEIFKIGSGKQVNNQQVLQMVERATGKKANVRYVDSLRSYDTDRVWLSDTTKIRLMGWEPKKRLTDSINEMVKAYVEKKNT